MRYWIAGIVRPDRRRTQAAAILSLALTVLAVTQVGRGWGNENEAERAVALATQLLPTVYPEPTRDLRVERPRSWVDESQWAVTARWVDGRGTASRARLTVDLRRREVIGYSGPPLEDVEDTSSAGRLRAAEAFARSRLGPITEAAELVSQQPFMEAKHRYQWANVLPSGAWTGDWWSVTICIDGAKRGVTGFSRHRAPRQVTEDEVRISRDQAIEEALAIVRLTGRDPRSVKVRDTRLILSSLVSPTKGPVWSIEMEDGWSGRLGCEIDAVTGKRLDPLTRARRSATPQAPDG